MKNKRDRTLPEKLHGANVLPNGALFDIPYEDIVIAKLEKQSEINKTNLNNEP